MVIYPNAVGGAMAMIVSFVATAALFVLLEAYFSYHSSAGLRRCCHGALSIHYHAA